MSLIFISYRRRDTGKYVRRIYDELEKQFGRGSIFLDVDRIPGGENWRERLDAALKDCRVMVALIGTRWLESQRLDDPNDFVRLEIEQALARKITIVPVLMEGARIPEKRELPPSLSGLTEYQGLPLDPGPAFDNQMERLVRDLQRLLSTQLDESPLLHAELLRLQSIIGDPVSDLAFILIPQPGMEPDDFGFRIMIHQHGSFFCFTKDGNLNVEDTAGNTITSYPTIGGGLETSQAFYSIDLAEAKKAISQHRLVHLRLADLEKATMDFMVKPHVQAGAEFSYKVSVIANVSNWMISCGVFALQRVLDGIQIPIFRDFVPASPFAEKFQLNVIGEYTVETAGEDWDNRLLAEVWSTVNAELEHLQLLRNEVQLPLSPGVIQKLPISVHFMVHVNQLISHLGLGEEGDAKILLHQIDRRTAQIIALLRTPTVRKAIGRRQVNAPPEELVGLTAYMLSYWNFLDQQGHAEYTDVPLARVVVLCPADGGIWVWVLEGEELNKVWRSQWTSIDGNHLAVSANGRQVLNRCTVTWRFYA